MSDRLGCTRNAHYLLRNNVHEMRKKGTTVAGEKDEAEMKSMPRVFISEGAKFSTRKARCKLSEQGYRHNSDSENVDVLEGKGKGAVDGFST